jgi:murein DD-endopeptidase MepM/ murein hydrolase activator NlpD
MSSSQPDGSGVPPPPPDLRPAPGSRSRALAPGVGGVLLLVVTLALALAGMAALAGNQPAGSPAGSAAVSPVEATAPPTQTAQQTDGSSPAPAAATTPPVAASPSAQPTPSPEVKQPPPTSAPPEELTGYVWPLRDARITSRFGPRDFGGFTVIDGDEVHDGLDLARFCGTKVRAAHDGTVLYAGRRFDDYMGYLGSGSGVYERLERQGRINTLPIVVVIDDGNGYRSVYVHLSEARVEAGQEVRAGEVIGLEGATGYATGCHLHYALIRMDGPWQVVVPQLHPYGYPAFVRERVDPLKVLPHDDEHAPARLRNKFASPSPNASAPAATPDVSPGASPGVSPSPAPTPVASP